MHLLSTQVLAFILHEAEQTPDIPEVNVVLTNANIRHAYAAHMLSTHDLNGDGRVSREEFTGEKRTHEEL